ncbi:ATP-binding cassette domain-containing protein [Paenibacillus chartarius]|uniref:ATP-binding cassette domain-containing protein n=1 Tax=Paenibacillus chartarius TaxID=747481 RepID=A0ABV6DL37_9BACL
MIRLIVYLLRQYGKHRLHSAGILLCMALGLGFTSAFSLSFKYYSDRFLSQASYERLLPLLFALLGGFVVYFFSQLLKEYWLARLAAAVANGVRHTLFEQLQRLPVSYYGKVGRGSLTARFTSDLSAIQTSFLALAPAAYALIATALYVMLTMTLHWSLGVLSLVGISLSLIVPFFLNRSAERQFDELKKRQVVVNDYIQEHFVVYKTIRAYNLRQWELSRLQQAGEGLLPLASRAQFTAKMVPVSVTSAMLLFNIMTILAGAYFVMEGELSIGVLLAFQSLFMALSQQVKELTQQAPQLAAASASLMRIERLLSEQPGPDAAVPEAAAALEHVDTDIALQGVTFGYSSQTPVIEGLQLRVPISSYVAIIGMNGSGKSTVVSLLMRFYEPHEGSVEFDGLDVRRLSAESLRERLGYVSQDTELMRLSILENIRLGKPGATDEEVIAAAEAAGIHRWISGLPQGYDTNCGDNGHMLSGGQKQRIAIARALVRDPDILLLDEATSALDPENEAFIHRTMRSLAGSKTVINVTHRLSAVTDADLIVLMDAGKLVQVGTHAELMANCALYRHLWNKQSGFDVSGDGRTARIDVERLERIPLFAGLEDEFLEFVSQCLTTEFVQAGETVVERGGEGDKLYIVARGTIEVLKPLPDDGDAEGRVAVLEDGDHFGEISLMLSMPRTATIRTVTPCTFLTIHRTLFQTILDRASPELRWRLEQSCRERLTY